MNQLWLELYNRECGEGLTYVKSEGLVRRRVITIPVSALLWNLPFTQYNSMYLYTM